MQRIWYYKYRLKPLYELLQVLSIDGIYKFEVAKFMAKVNLRYINCLYKLQSINDL